MSETKSLVTIENGGQVYAMILRANYHADGIVFFTDGTYSQQLGYMNRPEGYVIPPHVHNAVPREVQYTKEVLIIRKGKVRVDFYDEDQAYLESALLEQGDIILLALGGHGFQMLEQAEIVEVKQGPYTGEQDKTRFDPIPLDEVKMRTED